MHQFSKEVTSCDKGSFINGNWGHVFRIDGPAKLVRICFDSQAKKLVAMQVLIGYKWKKATPYQLTDVERSLNTVNVDAIEFPSNFGLQLESHFPEWVRI